MIRQPSLDNSMGTWRPSLGANRYNLGLRKPEAFDHANQLWEIAQWLIHADPQMFNPDNFYIFSWSGRLDFNVRLNAAYDLYKELAPIISQYIKHYGIQPKIRLLAHSHGGNVALNLARVANTSNLTIDELVLLACPVQCQTEPFSKKPSL